MRFVGVLAQASTSIGHVIGVVAFEPDNLTLALEGEDVRRNAVEDVKTVNRLLRARKVRSIRSDDLARLGVSLRKAAPFIVLPDHRPGVADPAMAVSSRTCEQLPLFPAEDACT